MNWIVNCHTDKLKLRSQSLSHNSKLFIRKPLGSYQSFPFSNRFINALAVDLQSLSEHLNCHNPGQSKIRIMVFV